MIIAQIQEILSDGIATVSDIKERLMGEDNQDYSREDIDLIVTEMIDSDLVMVQDGIEKTFICLRKDEKRYRLAFLAIQEAASPTRIIDLVMKKVGI